MSQPTDTNPTGPTVGASPPATTPHEPSHPLGSKVSAGLNTVEEKVESFFTHEAPADLYRYNYTKLAPLALIDVLPKAEKPRLNWYLHAALIALRTARNHLGWKPPSSAPTLVAAPPAPDGQHDLSHLGLGTVDLHQLSLDQVTPAHIEALDGAQLKKAHATGEPLPGANAGGIPLQLLKTLMQIAREALKRGVEDPMGMLRLVLGSSSASAHGRPQSLADYQGLFTTFQRPWFADRFESDDVFAYLRVAGFNPLVLQRVATLPPKFPVTEEQFRAGTGDAQDSLARAGAEGRLFLCDYEALARVKQGSFPAGPKYGFAPLALFALPRGTGPRALRAVAIQCGQDPRPHPVFTPADGEAWRKAKLVVTVADFNHHEMISHLGRTHLLIGPMPIATHRHLPEGHPVRTLLLPHFDGLLSINDLAQATLVAPGHEVDQSLSGTIQASRQLAVEGLHAKPFNTLFLPVDLEARGVAGPELDYPYRDDARAVWDAIERWVGAYVALYYPSDAAVRADAALQAWAAELVAQDGGRVPGLGDAGDGRLQTVAYLSRALTMIVFTSSAQHAAVNFPQGELLTFAPATPPAAYRAAPLSVEDSALSDFLDYLPPLEMAQLQMDFLQMLGGLYYTVLGQYEKGCFKDGRVAPLLARFQQELRDIEALITERNRTRFGPYTFLLPSRIPQSINI